MSICPLFVHHRWSKGTGYHGAALGGTAAAGGRACGGATARAGQEVAGEVQVGSLEKEKKWRKDKLAPLHSNESNDVCFTIPIQTFLQVSGMI